MSIQTQAILEGHIAEGDLLAAIRQIADPSGIVRPTHKQTYKLVELQGQTGPEVIHLFLESSAAEDYADVTDKPSTFVSAQLSPGASATVKRLAEAFGGFYRRTEQDAWEAIRPILASMPAIARRD
jgi:DNA-binding transcriptional MocR family regulator